MKKYNFYLFLILFAGLFLIQACGSKSDPTSSSGSGGGSSNTSTPTPAAPTSTPTITPTAGYNLTPVVITSPGSSFWPNGIGFDGGNLWTADGQYGGGTYSLDEYTTSGTLLGTSPTYNGTTNYNNPIGVNIGPDGTIYVGDYSAGLGIVLSSSGTFQTTIPSLPNVTNLATNSAGTTLYALLQTPNIYYYTINNHVIPRTFTYINDFPLKTFLTPGFLTTPQALAVDATNNVLVTDPGYGCITEFSPTGTSPVTFGTTALTEPDGLVFDSKGNLFVVQNAPAGFVQEFTFSGGVYSAGMTFGNSYLNDPTGITIDSSDDLFVANQQGHQIVEFKYY